MESYFRTASQGRLLFTPANNIVVGPIIIGCSGYSSILKRPWAAGTNTDALFGMVEAADTYAANVSGHGRVRGPYMG